tara:strand:- start:196 stop:444 length:249 start_codon:yes stop_codon:yes gene_type:complete
MNGSMGRHPMPKILKAFLFCYMGGYILSSHFGTSLSENVFLKITALTLGSVFFSYGVICFVDDFKKGGINFVINKIKKIIND